MVFLNGKILVMRIIEGNFSNSGVSRGIGRLVTFLKFYLSLQCRRISKDGVLWPCQG